MPIIDFPEDDRLPELMVHSIAALMLFPDDDYCRSVARKYGYACAIAAALASASQSAIDATPPDIRRQLRAWISLYAERAISDGEIRHRLVQGSIAGQLLHETIGRSDIYPNSPSMGLIKRKLAAHASDRFSTGISVSSIDNIIWPRFKPVSSLWAAYVSGAGIALERGDGIGPFPCRPMEVGNFLATSEAYRKRAENLKLPQASRSILDPGETWRVPSDLEIREVPLEFRRAA